MRHNKTFIISNRLPVRIQRTEDGLQITPSEGGLATGLSGIAKEKNTIWIGWPGIVPTNKEEEDLIRQKLTEKGLIPIFLTESELQGFYEGFSNEVLWPICHYHPSYAVFDKGNWEMYRSVNQKFADTVAAIHPSIEDTLWVHDYQLMLLPQMLRSIEPKYSIGYFHHIPFPPDEIFRTIPWRDQLLEGLLGADLVAFHTYTDAQHFLHACTHILGLPIQDNCLRNQGRSVFAEVFPMGIDFQKFKSLSQEVGIMRKASELKTIFQFRKIVLSIDRLDYSKGILHRLDAFEQLLITYPEWKEKAVLYMLVVPSRDNVPQYRHLHDEINRKVGHINAIYGDNGWVPVVYFYTSLPIEELVALYLAADCCLITSLRDGMNLVSKEYVACKSEQKGVLVLSELAGASKDLIGALLINPYAVEAVAETIHQALHMPIEEQRRRMNENVDVVQKFNVKHWVSLFYKRLFEIKTLQKEELARKVQDEVRSVLLQQYQSSHKRLFFLDYDGTLIGFHKDLTSATPTRSLYALLDQIQADPSNQVVIISGRPKDHLQQWFGDKGFYLVAEHGAWTNYPDFNWHSKAHVSTRWKFPVQHIMNKFANRTAGAFVEEKNYALAFHYRKVQDGLGQLRSQELMDSLRYLLPHHGLQLLLGNKVIEVKNSELNKGKAAMELVSAIQPDFIFAIGDDATDEDMFLELPNEANTVKVGNKKSAAKYYVEWQHEAIELLRFFIQPKSLNDPNKS
jgi:trehalose 6-phosphate synthase/phosphatase